MYQSLQARRKKIKALMGGVEKIVSTMFFYISHLHLQENKSANGRGRENCIYDVFLYLTFANKPATSNSLNSLMYSDRSGTWLPLYLYWAVCVNVYNADRWHEVRPSDLLQNPNSLMVASSLSWLTHYLVLDNW